MRLSTLLLSFCLVSGAVVFGCSDEASSVAPSPDGGAGEGNTNADGGGGADAASAAATGPLTPTKATNVETKINGVSRTLDRAQFGVTKEASGETLYLEAHEGGVPACPESETPKRTLIIDGVPKGAPGDRFTKDDGIKVSFLDFEGAQITTPNPLISATAATVTIVALDDKASLELEVDATFDQGTVKGRVYGAYCAAMSQ